jgi:acyl-ACP thioesterase
MHGEEFVTPPAGGRVFSQRRRPGLGDCAPSGRIRLDALARWLQDVAYADVEDAGVAQAAVWVVRRTRIRVQRFPRFREHFTVSTFCSGIGRMWAERRTTLSSDGGPEPEVEAVALWIHLDPTTSRPTPLTEAEFAAYGDAASGRRIGHRLRHPAPEAGARNFRWTFRASESDLARHINNAAYWSPLEEELLLSGTEPEQIDVEIEYRNPAQPGEMVVMCDGNRRWIVGKNGEQHASLLVSGAVLR